MITATLAKLILISAMHVRMSQQKSIEYQRPWPIFSRLPGHPTFSAFTNTQAEHTKFMPYLSILQKPILKMSDIDLFKGCMRVNKTVLLCTTLHMYDICTNRRPYLCKTFLMSEFRIWNPFISIIFSVQYMTFESWVIKGDLVYI